MVVTGTRAEFGLLRPVLDAIEAHEGLALDLVVAGAHFLKPAETWREVSLSYRIAGSVPMQEDGESGRHADARALGTGVYSMSREIEALSPDCVVVLGDRIEALAAACAASVGGVALAHIHGGDRAEGVADEAMRHAITKLAHLHFPATERSAQRILSMGEPGERVHVVGSPAVDGILDRDPHDAAIADELLKGWGDPRALVLMHPCGLTDEREAEWGRAAIEGVSREGWGGVLMPSNHDPGRDALWGAMEAAASERGMPIGGHLPRGVFVEVLRTLAERDGAIVGNSSAGLIEAAVLGLRCVNLGARQGGRERAGNCIDVELPEAGAIARALEAEIEGGSHPPEHPPEHPYGGGSAGVRIAEILADTDLRDPGLVRKRFVEP